jgi:hypothetical protein
VVEHIEGSFSHGGIVQGDTVPEIDTQVIHRLRLHDQRTSEARASLVLMGRYRGRIDLVTGAERWNGR